MKIDNKILPDFIVIGSMRSGTTTLYNYLDSHPEIGMSRQKETDFFIAKKHNKFGLNWYSNQFKDGFKIYGEISPNYSKARDFPGVPKLIKNVVPDCKFIYLIRDPVERFISQYNHTFLLGDNIDLPDDMVDTHEWWHIMDASLYHYQLSEYLKYFSLDQFMFIDFKDLKNNPTSLLSEISNNLGISNDWGNVSIKNHNSSSGLNKSKYYSKYVAKNRLLNRYKSYIPDSLKVKLLGLISSNKKIDIPQFSEKLKKIIANTVADDNAEFIKLIGKQFKGWKFYE